MTRDCIVIRRTDTQFRHLTVAILIGVAATIGNALAQDARLPVEDNFAVAQSGETVGLAAEDRGSADRDSGAQAVPTRPTPFGYLEYDWDADADIPGFDSRSLSQPVP